MEDSIVTSLVLPLALAIIMLGLGLSLVVGDFRRVLKEPKAMLIGLGSQLVVLPLIAFAIASVLDLPPLLAVGMMLLAACPGGSTSNLITHASRGDTALSVSLTAVSSVAILFTLPIIMGASIAHFVGQSQSVTLPVGQTMLQVFAIAVLPVLIGMVIRSRAPRFATRMERPVRIASIVLFVVIVLGMIVSNLSLIAETIGTLGVAVLALNLLTMAAGYGLARLGKLNTPQTTSVMIESGIQNSTLAIVIATTLLHQADVALPAGLYALVMFITGGVLIGWYGTRRSSQAATPVAPDERTPVSVG
ncbi:MAG: bile acid:sodium symporter family protein [Candidatus Nanopelagicales bacterium]